MSLDITDDKSTLVQVMAWCHQAITWANVDSDLCHHIVSLCHNGLIISNKSITSWDKNILNSKLWYIMALYSLYIKAWQSICLFLTQIHHISHWQDNTLLIISIFLGPQYIHPINYIQSFVLPCFVYIIVGRRFLWYINPYSSGLFCHHLRKIL